VRNWVTAVLVGAVLVAGAGFAPQAGVLAVVPAPVAVAAALIAVTAHEAWLLAAAAGAVSVLTTIVVLVATPGLSEEAGAVGLLECAALAVLIFQTVRRGRGRGAFAGAALATVASMLCILRVFPPAGVLERVGACATWSLGAAVAWVLGGYLRALERRRLASVAAARQAQRLALSRDLHDYVAHDVSGIVAQAQAAQFVRTPGAATEALVRIEAAGLRALAAMDRAMKSLATEDPGVPRTAISERLDAAALPDLVARFDAEGTVETRLELGSVGALPADVGETLYRLVSEALTNVRRHAAGATRVTVAVERSGGDVRATITDDGTHAATGVPGPDLGSARPDGGTGLPALRERISVLGGTLTAGPVEPGRGWRVRGTLPA
jgi:signal transduction histidine kinase